MRADVIRRGLENLVGAGLLCLLGIAALQLGQHVHAADDAAEDGVFAVELDRRHEADEELRAAAIGQFGLGHAQ